MLLPSIWTCAEDFAPDLNGPNHLAFHIKEMHFWVIKNLSNDQAVSKTYSEFKFKQCIHSQWNQVSRIPALNPVTWDVKHTCIPSWFSFLNNKDISVFFLMLVLKSNTFHKPFEPNGDFFHQSIYLNPTHDLSWWSSALSKLGEHAFIQEELEMKRCEIETCTALDRQSAALYRDIHQVSFCRGI